MTILDPFINLLSKDPYTALQNISGQDSHILIVSGFFPLAKSKHPMDDYSAWLARFLTSITTEIYFFCPPDIAPMIRSLRGDLPITINTSFSTPFDIPPLRGLESRYDEMHAWDREAFRHSPELYAVWSAKAFFLDEGVKNARGSAEYDYAFWNDAGSFRDEHALAAWPDGRRVDEVFEMASMLNRVPKEDIIFIPMWWMPDHSLGSWKEDLGPVDIDFSEGSFFGGTPAAITSYRHMYYSYHDEYLSRNMFVGKDQTLINALIFLFPSRFATVWLFDQEAPAHKGVPDNSETPLGTCGSSWFYYQWWLASAEEQEKTAGIWMRVEDYSKESWSRWRTRCRVTRVMGMDMVLKRQFGRIWTHPSSSFTIKDI